MTHALMGVGSSEKKSGNRKLLEMQIVEREKGMPQSRICTRGAFRKLRVPLCLMLTYQQHCILKNNETMASDSVKQLI